MPQPQHPKRNLVRHTQAKLTVTNAIPVAAEKPAPSPPVFSRSGRPIEKPSWMKDFVMTLLVIRTLMAESICFV